MSGCVASSGNIAIINVTQSLDNITLHSCILLQCDAVNFNKCTIYNNQALNIIINNTICDQFCLTTYVCILSTIRVLQGVYDSRTDGT